MGWINESCYEQRTDGSWVKAFDKLHRIYDRVRVLRIDNNGNVVGRSWNFVVPSSISDK